MTPIEDFSGLFQDQSDFNEDISSWDVSSVTAMGNVFRLATSFQQDISGWNVTAVTSMQSMFQEATSFNQDLSSWDFGSIIDAQYMFDGATAFNQDLCGWSSTLNVSASVTHMFLNSNCPASENEPYLLDGAWEAMCHYCYDEAA